MSKHRCPHPALEGVPRVLCPGREPRGWQEEWGSEKPGACTGPAPQPLPARPQGQPGPWSQGEVGAELSGAGTRRSPCDAEVRRVSVLPAPGQWLTMLMR